MKGLGDPGSRNLRRLPFPKKGGDVKQDLRLGT